MVSVAFPNPTETSPHRRRVARGRSRRLVGSSSRPASPCSSRESRRCHDLHWHQGIQDRVRRMYSATTALSIAGSRTRIHAVVRPLRAVLRVPAPRPSAGPTPSQPATRASLVASSCHPSIRVNVQPPRFRGFRPLFMAISAFPGPPGAASRTFPRTMCLRTRSSARLAPADAHEPEASAPR